MAENELFTMTPRELMETKHHTLTKMRLKQAEIIDKKQAIKTNENKLWLTTDFKAEGLTNDKMRTAFVNNELDQDKQELQWLEHDFVKFTDDLNLIDDLLKLIETENW